MSGDQAPKEKDPFEVDTEPEDNVTYDPQWDRDDWNHCSKCGNVWSGGAQCYCPSLNEVEDDEPTQPINVIDENAEAEEEELTQESNPKY